MRLGRLARLPALPELSQGADARVGQAQGARPGSTTKVYSSMQRDERGDREAEDSFGSEYSINWGWVRKGLKVVEGFSVLRLTHDGGVGIFPLSFCVPGHRVLL